MNDLRRWPSDMKRVEILMAVDEGRGITRAAERVHISQSRTSAQARQLEPEQGAELPGRSSRPVAVTVVRNAVSVQTHPALGQVVAAP